ncbi:MAG TPA: phosphatidylserine/phosphatidylglycerophosphate/cardiolipin synthase family protein [Gemmatimonadaceae bacterium]
MTVHPVSAVGSPNRISLPNDGPRPSFSRALWRIASADVSCGNVVTLLRDGAGTFETLLGLIESARETLDFECYIFRRDEIGQRFAKAFVEAAERGVRVRLLIDWFGMLPTPASFFRRLERPGLEVRFFNPPGFRRWLGLLPRDHRKLLVVDGRSGVTGGFGIGLEWRYGVLRRRRSPWRDTAVRIEGDAVKDLQQAFERMWARSRGHRPPRPRLMRPPTSSFLNTRLHPNSLVGIIEGEPGKSRVSRAMQIQAVAAEKSIWIASAYFMPSSTEIEALSGAARDGVDVRILVPSRYDHFWLRWLMTRSYHRLLRNGVRIWEWRGEMMHAKTSVVDGRWVRVGSTDFNPLSVSINYELDAVIEDPALGVAAEAMFIEDLQRSRELRPPARFLGPRSPEPAARLEA